MMAPADTVQALHEQALALLTQLRPLAVRASGELQGAWAEHLDRLDELVKFLAVGGSVPLLLQAEGAVSEAQWAEFGRLLRDKRTAAGLSRVDLARRAKLSDATIKLAETARRPPSRATLVRLVEVAELKLRWAEVPGRPAPPAAAPNDAPPEAPTSLNCLLAPGYDPLGLRAELARFLQGAGGYLEQTSAYLDPGSAAAYLALCQHGPLSATLRSHLPLIELAEQIVAAGGRSPLQVIALGAGDGHSETQLVRHLMEAGTSRIELCLLDINQPLLTSAYRHAVDRLAQPQVQVWALQGNFHQLPLYTVLHRPAARRPRRLFTLLGSTLAHLDHEPRFLQQCLLACDVDDLLLLDVPLACAPCTDRAEIKRRDRLFAEGVPAAYAEWLAGPLWRYCPQVERVDFHWDLETPCPVPGSYALHAIATVMSSQRADRRFSLLRLGRYDPAQLAQCLREMGWEELGAELFGGEHSLRLYRKRPAGQWAGSWGTRAREGKPG
jgi:transcriptional regulator with XRE-family HTH domain